MIRPVLLAALVVCSLGSSFAAVQPAAGDVLSDTPSSDGANESDRESTEQETPDGSDRDRYDDGADDRGDDDDRRWYDRWGSDDENQSDDHNRSVGEDTDRNGTDDGTDERSSDRNSTEAGDDGDDRSTARDGSARGDRVRLPPNATVRVLDLAGGTVRGVTDGTLQVDDREGAAGAGLLAPDVTGAPDLGTVTGLDDPTVERSVAPRVGGLLAAATDEELRGVDDTVESVLDGSTVLLTFDEWDDGSDGDRPSSGNASEEVLDDGDGRTGTAATAADPGTSPPSAGELATPLDHNGASDPGGDGGADDEDPVGNPAGASAALVLTVGCLGGSRVAVSQASLLVSPGVDGTLASLRRVAGEHFAGLPDRVVPPVFGYSRHDASDPLENETRTAIYDLVCESPGIYHARLAEETGVAVETVRYHCRILAEEGLVEPRKHRGKRRLYPVTMDDDDPELAAAIADSAAADVLSAIERLEPATLSAVAEHVDCAPSTVAYHLDRLEEDGLVSRERDGGAVQVRLRRSTRSALEGTVADD